MPVGNIDRVLIELRPRLQSANFFICFSRRFVEIKSTKIDLAPDRIKISTENNDEQYNILLGEFFKLHTQTLSSLLIKNNYVCFRINTNENKFHSEVLEINEYNACTELKLECRLKTGVSYSVTCSNCGNDLHEKPATFKRILELPSDHMDSNDWYCHRHDTPETQNGGEGECSSKSQPSSKGFTPTETDLFYGPFYALLNRNHLQRVHLRADRFFYCKCCLKFLGVLKRNGTAKLWYENLQFLKPDEDEQDNVNPLSLFHRNALANFQYLVRKTVNDYNFISHLGLPPIFKIIFEMRRPGTDGDTYYLLMQIMDANLNVFKIRSNENSDEDYSSGSEDLDDDNDDKRANNIQRRNIYVDRHRTMKVMYRYEKFEQQPIFNFWLQDNNVVNVEISEQMFRAAVRYLDDNSDYVPECYRNNMGFSLSYLDIT